MLRADLSFLEKYGISYMEKNGLVQMTDEDLDLYYKGQVSERLVNSWGIQTVEELREIVESKQFEIIKTNI